MKSETDGQNHALDVAEATQPVEPAEDTSSVNVLAEELAAMKDRWMRAEAENANVRARAKRDVDDARSFAIQKFATDAIETAENMQRALARLPAASKAEPESLSGLRVGLHEIERGFLVLLERNGVKKQDPAGQAFDPNLHQAMSEQESTDQPKGTILTTLSPVWTLNGRLLKPAMVVVAKAPPSQG